METGVNDNKEPINEWDKIKEQTSDKWVKVDKKKIAREKECREKAIKEQQIIRKDDENSN